ncbi:Uncharacterised protein [Dermatophilus congolensis]|uniref:Uncharacterized protein n=1 Tax=Dermatophilus congolensis TaxID=1863 RepID=A0AA46H1I7_9MICO|nr:Uncharacterised protein [Dermatophilus congolensis]
MCGLHAGGGHTLLGTCFYDASNFGCEGSGVAVVLAGRGVTADADGFGGAHQVSVVGAFQTLACPDAAVGVSESATGVEGNESTAGGGAVCATNGDCASGTAGVVEGARSGGAGGNDWKRGHGAYFLRKDCAVRRSVVFRLGNRFRSDSEVRLPSMLLAGGVMGFVSL